MLRRGGTGGCASAGAGLVLVGDRRKLTAAGWRSAGVSGAGKALGVSGGSVMGIAGDTSAGASSGVITAAADRLLLPVLLAPLVVPVLVPGFVGDVRTGIAAGDASGRPPVGDTRRPSDTPAAAYGSCVMRV